MNYFIFQSALFLSQYVSTVVAFYKSLLLTWLIKILNYQFSILEEDFDICIKLSTIYDFKSTWALFFCFFGWQWSTMNQVQQELLSTSADVLLWSLHLTPTLLPPRVPRPSYKSSGSMPENIGGTHPKSGADSPDHVRPELPPDHTASCSGRSEPSDSVVLRSNSTEDFWSEARSANLGARVFP